MRLIGFNFIRTPVVHSITEAAQYVRDWESFNVTSFDYKPTVDWEGNVLKLGNKITITSSNEKEKLQIKSLEYFGQVGMERAEEIKHEIRKRDEDWPKLFQAQAILYYSNWVNQFVNTVTINREAQVLKEYIDVDKLVDIITSFEGRYTSIMNGNRN